ncbi:MAG: DNA alkylation repair protein, partial [Saprospiraceae bacterium]
GMKWILSDKENIAAAGWATLSSTASIMPDETLDIPVFSQLLDKVAESIHSSPNRVRMAMNSFVIAVGTYIKDLTDRALLTASKIGLVSVDMNGTSCKVPAASDYINKNIMTGKVGNKRKQARC